MRAPPARLTNLTLLAALLVTFATGLGAVATGSEHGRWVVIGHGIAGMAVILLIPWKSRIVQAGLRTARRSRWASLTLAGLTAATLLFGLGYTTGLISEVGGIRGMWLHIAAALVLVPLALWHVLARKARPKKTDLSRRTLLRTGAIGVAAAGLYGTAAAAVHLAQLPGTRRRFTGSYLAKGMPVTSWLDDQIPTIDPAQWRLTVVDARGRRELTLQDLTQHHVRLRATLDCTSGWYAHEEWTGVPVDALIREVGTARSLYVHSVTGYGISLPLEGGLLLATGVGGAPLTPGHGYPLRLVAQGRRGFWWVKWVDRIELQDTPWWWQPPFPIT